MTPQQEQEQIERAERSRDCCRGKCTNAKAAQALLSLHGRLEACEESRLRWNRKWSEANDELTEARKAISESDMLRSLAYSERDEACARSNKNHDAARGFQGRALRAERDANEYRKMAEEQQQARVEAWQERDEARKQLDMMREAFEGLHRITPTETQS